MKVHRNHYQKKKIIEIEILTKKKKHSELMYFYSSFLELVSDFF